MNNVSAKKILFIICELYWRGAQKSLLKVITEVAKCHDCVLAVNKVADSFAQNVPVPLIEIDKASNITEEGFSVFHKINRLLKRVSFVKRLKKKEGFDKNRLLQWKIKTLGSWTLIYMYSYYSKKNTLYNSFVTLLQAKYPEVYASALKNKKWILFKAVMNYSFISFPLLRLFFL